MRSCEAVEGGEGSRNVNMQTKCGRISGARVVERC